jgi:hypothetical protein
MVSSSERHADRVLASAYNPGADERHTQPHFGAGNSIDCRLLKLSDKSVFFGQFPIGTLDLAGISSVSFRARQPPFFGQLGDWGSALYRKPLEIRYRETRINTGFALAVFAYTAIICFLYSHFQAPGRSIEAARCLVYISICEAFRGPAISG